MLLTINRFSAPHSQRIAQGLRSTGIVNLFNPSIQTSNDGFCVAFRGLAKGTSKPFQGFLARIDNETAQIGPVLNLTKLLEPEIGAPVCDPKLFRAGSRCWLTFNTGHFERPNRIYVAQVEPELGPLFLISFADRSEIEKNWAFFEHDGLLHALYSISPLIILRETMRENGVIHFHPLDATEKDNISGSNTFTGQPQLTIGTQLSALDSSGTLFGLISHRRHYLRGKRIYLGVPTTLHFERDGYRISTGKRTWTHSMRALLGSSTKHNPNLFSCTYFSGMTVIENKALVSYGINDVDFSLAEVPLTYWGKTDDMREKKGA